MRKNFIAILLISLFFNYSCDKQTPHVNTLSALIDGTPYVGSFIRVYSGVSSLSGNRYLGVEAMGTDGRKLSFSIANYFNTISTYTGAGGGIIPAGSGLGDFISSTNAEIIITSIDNSTYKNGEVVNGTFRFDTDSSHGTVYIITNGQFSVYVPN